MTFCTIRSLWRGKKCGLDFENSLSSTLQDQITCLGLQTTECFIEQISHRVIINTPPTNPMKKIHHLRFQNDDISGLDKVYVLRRKLHNTFSSPLSFSLVRHSIESAWRGRHFWLLFALCVQKMISNNHLSVYISSLLIKQTFVVPQG